MSSPELAAAQPFVLLFLALLIDAVVGDMRWFFRLVPHPIVLVGRLIGFLDDKLNRSKRGKAALLIRGCIVTVLVTGLAAALGYLCTRIAGSVPYGEAFELFLIVVLVAQRSLYDHGHAVSSALKRDGVEAGRAAVSHIVGRDTTSLDEHGVARGAIESLAENFADGVVAPAFWYLILGLPGLFAYKAINTLDSMIGYKSERYRHFGMVAARLDDAVNLIPARLSAIFLVFAGAVTPTASPARATRIVWRDAGKHDSPNAGWPEAAMAGALDRALGGPRTYLGGVEKSEWIGDGDARATVRDIDRALLLYGFACLIHALFYAAVAAMVLGW
ncbi:MAG: adenosylcobinamide-phosphate synthase CbiB [Rhodospirillaceae bacterium]|nr:adenosylcobinamide-phosphate synthase CbiB [Rhodospirillaceae bacterium]MDD9918450.1 adenosylcobinamide-phosphate synthase CbiB [Rhodospirillaceae bacterium]MDD9925467.1 adenosylcobinamide-phosphate synthase CbiB [Rhodospirillaceae bacterium]